MRYGKSAWVGAAAVAGVLLCAGATWSEPARGGACSACDQRVAALEVRVARLEKQIAELQARTGIVKTRPAAEKTAPAPPTAAGQNHVKTFPPVGGCSPPYSVDAQGIRKPKPGCESAGDSACDPPYAVDAQGLRRPKPECLR